MGTSDVVEGDTGFCARVPVEFAREHQVIGLGMGEGTAYRVAVGPGCRPAGWWNLGSHLGSDLERVELSAEAVLALIDRTYSRVQGDVDAAVVRATSRVNAIAVGASDEDLDRVLREADRDLLATDGKAPVVQVVDQLLLSAVRRGASDLHLQPMDQEIRMRLRVDGVLDGGKPLPAALATALVSRIKVIGRMDVAERMIPQDGRASVRLGDQTVDLRISTIPTAFGERVVVRLLDTARGLIDLDGLGMPAAIQTTFLGAAQRASGIILVTGPTGSGKSTTIYAALRRLQVTERNIMTIEDPIEYELSAMGIPISQTQVNTRKGVTFATGLRHLLRQDPDVILVGEIRDQETARLAIQASLTGHLVFSTLHTNDAVAAVARLLDLGVEPYLVASTLTHVLAQRLVRTLCAVCSGSGHMPGGPCPTCGATGFHGRLGLFELMSVTEPMRALMGRGASQVELRAAAIFAGMQPLDSAGAAMVASGRTTQSEVDRVIHHG